MNADCVCTSPTHTTHAKYRHTESLELIQAFSQHDKSCESTGDNITARGHGMCEQVSSYENDRYISNDNYKKYRLVTHDDYEIPINIRRKIQVEIQWMFGIKTRYKLETDTFCLAASYLVLVTRKHPRMYEFRGVAAGAIIIAAKMQEVVVKIGIKMLLRECTSLRKYSYKQFVYYERFILRELEWRVSYIMTQPLYSYYLCMRLGMDNGIQNESIKNIEYLKNTDFIMFMSTYDIVVGCILCISGVQWTEVFKDSCPLHTRYHVEHIWQVVSYLKEKRSLNLDMHKLRRELTVARTKEL